MATDNKGKIINISSVHEELPFPHFTSYCASKGGVKMITRNLAVELGPMGITINNVAPGAIATPINHDLLNNPEQLKKVTNNIPLGRMGEPEDVSGIVAFLMQSLMGETPKTALHRFTITDRAIEERVRSFHVGDKPPSVSHMLAVSD